MAPRDETPIRDGIDSGQQQRQPRGAIRRRVERRGDRCLSCQQWFESGEALIRLSELRVGPVESVTAAAPDIEGQRVEVMAVTGFGGIGERPGSGDTCQIRAERGDEDGRIDERPAHASQPGRQMSAWSSHTTAMCTPTIVVGVAAPATLKRTRDPCVVCGGRTTGNIRAVWGCLVVNMTPVLGP
jgi:hypothetical protein